MKLEINTCSRLPKSTNTDPTVYKVEITGCGTFEEVEKIRQQAIADTKNNILEEVRGLNLNFSNVDIQDIVTIIEKVEVE